MSNSAVMMSSLRASSRVLQCRTAGHGIAPHRAQSGLIRRDREIRIFGYFSFFMHARIISERDFQTIHLKIIITKKAFLVIMI